MRVVSILLAVFVLFSSRPSNSQNPPPLAPGAQPQGPQWPVQQFYAQDGGTREILESIVVPPKPKAPFSMVLQTEWVKTLSDGGTMTLVNQRRIARDSAGRIYEERWALVPKYGKVESQMTAIQIADPNRHTLYNCFPLNPRHQCMLSTFTASTSSIYRFQGAPTGPLPNKMGSATHEDLGTQLAAGMETTGTRDSITYDPGVFGNDQAMTIVREFWYSSDLGINLLSKLSDPRIGTQTFTATDLQPSEPDSNLFKLPAGFKVVDQRGNVLPEN
ncbi:MAG: hypothetical protein ACRD2U_12825 [Terriglobales bacterium]